MGSNEDRVGRLGHFYRTAGWRKEERNGCYVDLVHWAVPGSVAMRGSSLRNRWPPGREGGVGRALCTGIVVDRCRGHGEPCACNAHLHPNHIGNSGPRIKANLASCEFRPGPISP